MTGKIRTLRVDKGFGFIKDEAGKEVLLSPERRFRGADSTISERATVWSSRWARGQRALAPKTCAARLRKRTESRRRPCVGLVCCGGHPDRNGDELAAGTLPAIEITDDLPREGPSARRHALDALAKCPERPAGANERRRAVVRLTAAPCRTDSSQHQLV